MNLSKKAKAIARPPVGRAPNGERGGRAQASDPRCPFSGQPPAEPEQAPPPGRPHARTCRGGGPRLYMTRIGHGGRRHAREGYRRARRRTAVTPDAGRRARRCGPRTHRGTKPWWEPRLAREPLTSRNPQALALKDSTQDATLHTRQTGGTAENPYGGAMGGEGTAFP